jgi:hypothetical protein
MAQPVPDAPADEEDRGHPEPEPGDQLALGAVRDQPEDGEQRGGGCRHKTRDYETHGQQ